MEQRDLPRTAARVEVERVRRCGLRDKQIRTVPTATDPISHSSAASRSWMVRKRFAGMCGRGHLLTKPGLVAEEALIGGSEQTNEPSCVERIALRPVVVAVYVGLTIVAGLLASAEPDKIMNAFPFYWKRGPWSWFAFTFWGTVGLAACLYWVRTQSADSARERAQEELRREARELKANSQDLAQLMRTMPPRNFLSLFNNVLTIQLMVVDQLERSDKAELTTDEVARVIRTVLEGVITLAKRFDESAEGVVYGANVMRYIPTKDRPTTDVERYAEALRFCPPELSIQRLAGVLHVDPTFSASTSDNVSGAVDPDLPAFALPFPADVRNGDGKWRILPGAPLAFHRAQCGEPGYDGYADTHTLSEWCRTEGAFDPQVVEKLDQYFNSAPLIRSFSSIALKAPNDQPQGVLNIHRNTVGVLRETGAAGHFYELMGPFGLLFLRLLRLYDDLTAAVPAAAPALVPAGGAADMSEEQAELVPPQPALEIPELGA